MVSVIYPCAVFFKFFRDSAPVIEILEISEKYAVHKQNRIFCSAYPLPAPHHVQLIFRLFEAVFPVSSGNDIKKRDYIEHGNPRKNDTEHTLFYAELIAAGIYEDYPDPEKQRAEKYDRRKPDYKKRLIFQKRQYAGIPNQIMGVCDVLLLGMVNDRLVQSTSIYHNLII